MKNKYAICWTVIALSVLAFFVMYQIIGATQTLSILSLENSCMINYNNYTNCISDDYNLDYRDGKFAWGEPMMIGSKLTIFNNNEKSTVYRRFSSCFQLCGTQIVYLINSSLFLEDSNTKSIIATKVDTFVAHKDGIVYSISSEESEGHSIYWYDFESQNDVLITDNAVQYCVSDDKLVVLIEDGWIMVYTKETTEKCVQIEIDHWPIVFQLCHKQIVYTNGKCQLEIVDLDTKDSHTIVIDELCSNSRVAYICNDEKIYYSIEATHTNGSIVSNVAKENNGVWLINPVTLEKRKICNETFERLYLFNSDLLIGIKDREAYQIDATTGKVSKLIK